MWRVIFAEGDGDDKLCIFHVLKSRMSVDGVEKEVEKLTIFKEVARSEHDSWANAAMIMPRKKQQ
jgi:hypothetical protein